MAQSTLLAPGLTAETSADIVVPAGGAVLVGIFSASDAGIGNDVRFHIVQDTPGADNYVEQLGNHKRYAVITGPGTYRVKRPAYQGPAFGVFKEDGA